MTPTRTSASITLRNLITARWVLLVLVGAAASFEAFTHELLPALAGWLPANEHPLTTVLVLGLWAALNGASRWALDRDHASDGLAGVHLLIDASALTVLFVLAGGPSNPFTTLYFLPVTLATQISPRWTWALAGFCLACFASLFVIAPVGGAEPGMAGMHGAGAMHSDHFTGHLRGMWVAFGLSGALMTFFVHRIALAIARQRAELGRLRQAALEDRHLAAIGTLAAGAAHELGTPLGTIKLLVDELPLMDEEERAEALATVREQLDRCKGIVSGMASPELRVTNLAASDRPWPLRDLVDELADLDPGVPLRVELRPAATDAQTVQPYEVLAQLLRELVANGAEACRRVEAIREPAPGVHVTIDLDADDAKGEPGLRVEVRDEGVGMDAETLASAFDPFFSTRPEGAGMGMGLYLARAHLRQLGGTIELDSTPGEGTRATLCLPPRPAISAATGGRGPADASAR